MRSKAMFPILSDNLSVFCSFAIYSSIEPDHELVFNGICPIGKNLNARCTLLDYDEPWSRWHLKVSNLLQRSSWKRCKLSLALNSESSNNLDP